MTKSNLRKKDEKRDEEFNFNLEEMAQAGLSFGHRTFRTHPKMKVYISSQKNSVHIIDLEKTAEKLKEALEFIKEFISEGKTLLLVDTKVQTKDLIKSIAEECNLPYVNERWLGGTFTNFETIKKRIEYFLDLENKKTSGDLEKYTKKERARFDEELKRLKKKFQGIKNLEKIPEAIFVVDMKKDDLAVKEAREKGVKVVAIAHTNVDPNLADYPIPANDDSVSSVKYILEKIKEVILNAKPKIQSSDAK